MSYVPARIQAPQWLYLLTLAAWLFCASAQGAPSVDTQRQLFGAAEWALQRGDEAQFKQLKAGLKDYPLYPYLLYRDLQRRLDQTPASEVQAFLTAHEDTPLAARLRNAWLRHLAAEQRWSDFLRFYQPSQDAAMDCWHRQALLRSGQRKAALQGIDRVWMSGTSLPDTCDPLFRIFREQGGFTRERVWQRFALAMRAGESRLARYLQGLMPAEDRSVAELWLTVDRDPARVLDRHRFDPNSPHTPAILLHGLQRWSNIDSVAAAAALDTLKRHYRLPREEELATLERRLALFVASRGHPDAPTRLAALPPEQVDTSVREWRVRTGLQRGDWHATLRWLEQLSPEESNSPQWQYWRARALEAIGKAEEAGKIYRQLAGRRDYYGFLAADRVGMPYQNQHAPLQIASKELERLEHSPAIQRARELYRLERHWEARLEWMQAIRGLSTEDLKKAAKLAQHWGWHDRSIVTLARTGYWDDLELRFPLPYRHQVITNAQSENIDPAWIYAIMRQESIFQADIRSGAGALGLMQVMPATGQHIARDLQTELSNSANLLQTDLNIRFGTRYLRLNLENLQENPLLATAAYNAGRHAVKRWLPAQGPVDADLWVETIPYFETRGYVKRIMEYATIYEQRLGQPARTLRMFMQPIQPLPDTPG